MIKIFKSLAFFIKTQSYYVDLMIIIIQAKFHTMNKFHIIFFSSLIGFFITIYSIMVSQGYSL